MNIQDMERKCCVKAGIERYTSSFYEHSYDGRVVQVYAVLYENESVRPNVKQPVVYDEPTGSALVEQIKAWCEDNDDANYMISSYKGRHFVVFPHPMKGHKDWHGTRWEADTEHEAFIKAFHAAFCKENDDDR
jgi:hypothetical protein